MRRGRRWAGIGRHEGFTLMEVLVAMMLFGLVMAISAPRVGSARHTLDANRATRGVALDLEQALSMAARQRTPIRIVQPSSTLQFVIEDAETGTVFQTRDFGDGSDADLATLTLDPSSVIVFPTGRTSGQLTVTLDTGDLTRTVTMSQAGRIVVNP